MFSTTDDCYRYVLLAINKQNAGTLEPVQFERLFNAAQRTVIARAYEHAEQDQYVVDALRILTPPPSVIANTGLNATEQEVFNLPFVANPPAGTSQGYMHLLSVGMRVAKLVNNQVVIEACQHPSGWSPARLMPRDNRYSFEENPFWEPTAQEPYYYLIGNTLRAKVPQGSFAERIRIEYLRYPIDVVVNPAVDPELPPIVNQRICDRLVTTYLESVESARVNTQGQLNRTF